jgi:16S rRNA (cytidine1402-2'-O)-methyltransferase
VSSAEAGKLYLVATPIGNLLDITLRALEILKSVDVVAAEDTRRTRALLTHFEIRKVSLQSFNAHSESGVARALVERLSNGQSVALVTDAGTPSVSDPGTELVRAAVSAGVPVVPIPGVSAVTAAVAASGLVEGPFTFLGFLPPKGSGRRESLNRVLQSLEPSVLFEAPHRMQRTMDELAALAPDRLAVACRELTKIHEEFRRGTLAELAKTDEPWRGEITLVVDRAPDKPKTRTAEDWTDLDAMIVESLQRGLSARDVVDALLQEAEVPRRELYRRVTELSQRLRGTTSSNES